MATFPAILLASITPHKGRSENEFCDLGNCLCTKQTLLRDRRSYHLYIVQTESMWLFHPRPQLSFLKQHFTVYFRRETLLNYSSFQEKSRRPVVASRTQWEGQPGSWLRGWVYFGPTHFTEPIPLCYVEQHLYLHVASGWMDQRLWAAAFLCYCADEADFGDKR